jgi:hypothetical protein
MPNKQEPAHKSDRENYGLRGLVSLCVEEAFNSLNPTHSMWNSVGFDREGRFVSRRARGLNGPDSSVHYVYGPSGLLMKTFSDQEESAWEIVHTYDRLGRIEKTTSAGVVLALYSYDSNGMTTKTQAGRSGDYKPNLSAGGSPFSIADRRPNLPDGGTATTSYDKHDRPVECKVHNSQGERISSATRTYDELGRVVEEKLVMEDPMPIFPSAVRSNPDATGWMNAHAGVYSIKFFYDSANRVTRTVRQNLDQEDVVVTTYNELGDPALEITTSRPVAGSDEGTTAAETRYSYQYDQAGNWTEKIALNLAEGAVVATVMTRRNLEYF